MEASNTSGKGVISVLNRLIERSILMQKNGSVKLNQVKLWSKAVHSQLIKIYAFDNEICKYWLPKNIPDNVDPTLEFETRVNLLKKYINAIQDDGIKAFVDKNISSRVFIGHGRSPVWRELKDFLSDRLDLPWDEFNREAVAGLSTFDRISEMLNSASFAFLIMTAEDQHSNESTHARQNVVHEVGLFQGKLGPRKAIILLEDGCEEFSNIIGLSQIRFPQGNISSSFEEIRRVLEREGIINT